MRVLVCGGRNFDDLLRAECELRALLPGGLVTVVHGAASGADRIAGKVARAFGWAVEEHPADWTGPCRPSCKPGHRRAHGSPGPGGYCPAAGVYRNQQMLDTGIDLVVAFPGGRGTADMVRRAKGAGVPVEEIAP